jgi:hypothetical protein
MIAGRATPSPLGMPSQGIVERAPPVTDLCLTVAVAAGSFQR